MQLSRIIHCQVEMFYRQMKPTEFEVVFLQYLYSYQ